MGCSWVTQLQLVRLLDKVATIPSLKASRSSVVPSPHFSALVEEIPRRYFSIGAASKMQFQSETPEQLVDTTRVLEGDLAVDEEKGGFGSRLILGSSTAIKFAAFIYCQKLYWSEELEEWSLPEVPWKLSLAGILDCSFHLPGNMCSGLLMLFLNLSQKESLR